MRPEAVQLFREKPAGYENWVEGSILDVTFKGPYVDYLVDVSPFLLKVHQSLYEGVTVFGRGESVHLAWCPEDMLVLSA